MSRILHLIPQLEEGGAQTQLSHLVSRSQKYEMEVASLIASPPEKVLPGFRNLKIPIHFLSYSEDYYAPEIIPALKKILSERKYSAVHCWLFQSIVQGVIVSRLKSIPVIASPRSTRNLLQKNSNKLWEQWLIRKALHIADLALFPSCTISVDFIEAGWVKSSRARVVQNGVDPEHFQSVEGGDAIVAVGRLAPEKSYEDLKVVFERLRQRIPEARFIVAGGGKQPQWEGVEFTGFVEDVRTVLHRGAIYISTSSFEGLSNALLEAQAMSIPAVVRNKGFNSELIEHGVNGFLANSMEDFVEACLLLWKNPGLRKQMGQQARDKITTQFCLNNQIRKIESIYEEVL